MVYKTQWVSSIKTRIKTHINCNLWITEITQWVSSIKTRIKTSLLPLSSECLPLNEYLPLKQGLRLYKISVHSHGRLNEYLPLKQGLRLAISFSFFIKLTSQWVSSIKTRIKTLCLRTDRREVIPKWVSSIKTRIKTCKKNLEAKNSQWTEWVSSIKTRIKTQHNQWSRFHIVLNEYLPLKQGLRQML